MTNPPIQWSCERTTASSPPAASTNARTTCAGSGPWPRPWPDRRARSVRVSRRGRGRASGVERRADGVEARSTRAGTPDSSTTVADPGRRPPSRCRRNRTVVTSSATFWWITELANLVKGPGGCGRPGVDLGARRRPSRLDCDRRQVLLGARRHALTPTRTSANRAGAEGCRCGRPGPAGPPQLGVPRDRLGREHVHRGPEPRPDAGVGRVAQQTAELAVLDLVTDLGAELEVQSPVVDRPGAVGLHVDPVVVAATISSNVWGPGSRPTFVIRTMGRRAQPSARTLPA